MEHTLHFEVGTENTAMVEEAHIMPGVVASVNSEQITEEDLEFYQFINELQISLYRENDILNYEGEELEEAMRFWDTQLKEASNVNTLLTQIIRLRAVALLGLEKGYKAKEEEVQAEIAKIQNQYDESELATEMIERYGKERFWKKQQTQYELIVLTQKVQQDVIESVKKENEDAQQEEINYLAHKSYEELLVAQVETLNIKIHVK